MARRESQGLQIALILFVMLTVALAVTTYLFWSKSDNLNRALTDMQQKKQQSDSAASASLLENQKLKQMLGHASGEELSAIESTFESDMKVYAQGLSETQRNYKDLPAHMLQVNQERSQQIAQLSQREKELLAEIKKTQETEQALTAQARETADKTAADLEKMRLTFDEDRGRKDQQLASINSQLDKKRRELENLAGDSTEKQDALNSDIKRLNMRLDQQIKENEELVKETFEVPDGRVDWVTQKTGVATINLGRADGLRRQVTFSVYNIDENKLAESKPKGKIEVVRILGDHKAEARIVDDEITNPILPGDVLYSPVWTAGNGLRFAFAGLLDYNGDGVSDRKLLRNLLKMNGGIIDAEDVGGKIKGKMSVHTRYLIVGEQPQFNKTADAAALNGQIEAYSGLLREAEYLGVEEIPVNRLLDLIGYHGDATSIPLGRDARVEDFRAEADGVIRSSNGSTSELFRQRRPTRARGRKSAF